MPKRTRPIKNKWQIVIYFYLLLIILSLLTAASYTWFSISQTPRVSDLYLFVNAPSGLELSTDPLAADEEWVLQLDFREMVTETSPLRPVTWSDVRQQFFAARYGADGRLFDITDWEPLTDDRHANKDNLDGYYIKSTFYARSGQKVRVSLSPAVEVDEGIQGSGTYVIGTPLWDDQNILHNNGGQGAECAIRLAFRITPVDQTGRAIGASDFYIYEPNSDLHESEPPGYIPTPSIDNAPHLTAESHLICQTASTWTEAYPIQRGVVIHELGEFTTPTDLFTLDPDGMARIELYIWLEGQDVDCTNRIQEAQILASVQFATTTEDQSGMVPIK